MPLDLVRLNPSQQQAVLATEGPSLILAGPGAGKTRVLTYRIAHLLDSGAAPIHRIMALTFTNKAAKEMHQRLSNLLGTKLQHGWIGTFHSIFAKILRMEADTIGYANHFSIYDRDDSINLLKRLVKEMKLDEERYKAKVLFSRISWAKNNLIGAEEYLQNPAYAEEDARCRREHMGMLFQQYAQACRQAEAMDFDDLIFLTYKLIKNHPHISAKYQQRFSYVLVDEFQDTNNLQWSLLKILTATHRNLCVVGDDAQSIYAFRGASVKHILHFHQTFPDAKHILLTQNYRSTPQIVAAANALIKQNQHQYQKEIFTTNKQGPPLGYAPTRSCEEEARFVVHRISAQSQQQQHTYDKFAILYRTNSQSRLFEEQLRRQSIPYKLVGGTAFYQRQEIKDLLAYLRLVVNTHDEQALRRIINQPKRGIGNATLAKATTWAKERKISLWEALKNISTYKQSSATVSAIQQFVHLIEELRTTTATQDAYEATKKIAQASGLVRSLYADKTPQGISRYENVQELLHALQLFVQNRQGKHTMLPAFLAEVALMTSEEGEEEPTPRVHLLTIHAAKGLEFPHVHIVGMEEGLFPSSLMLDSKEKIAEELRLFYVALTRAQKTVCISYATSRLRFGRVVRSSPSRFLEALPTHCLELLTSRATPPHPRNYRQAQHKKPITLIQQYAAETNNTLVVGTQVRHATFGIGKVMTINKHSTRNLIATIAFASCGTKKILLQHAKLTVMTPST